jgi:hypothetical protein
MANLFAILETLVSEIYLPSTNYEGIIIVHMVKYLKDSA